jgi:hypothetical protein
MEFTLGAIIFMLGVMVGAGLVQSTINKVLSNGDDV